MADVETDALRSAALGEIEEVLVLHDARPGLAVEAVGDDVAGSEDLQHFVIERRRLADMHHHRHFQNLGDLLAELDWRDAPGSGDDMAGAHLDADDVLAVFGIDFENPVEIYIADIPQFRDAVAGDEADRAEIEEGLDAFARRLDDIFPEAMEIRLTGRTGIDQRSDAALDTAFGRADGNIGTAVPDMHVQVDPARRNEGALAVDARHILRDGKRRTDLGDPAVGIDENVGCPSDGPEPKAIGLTLVRRSGFFAWSPGMTCIPFEVLDRERSSVIRLSSIIMLYKSL